MKEKAQKLGKEFEILTSNLSKVTEAAQVRTIFDSHIERTAPMFKGISNIKNKGIIIELRAEQTAAQRQVNDYMDTLKDELAFDGAKNTVENYTFNKAGIINVLSKLG